MSSIKTNIVANFVGKIWISLLGIVVVPFYLKYIGVEVYGIVGLFTTVQLILSLLDAGLSPTMTREMARLSGLPEKSQEMSDLARTLEVPYWAMGILVTVIYLILSPILARYWLVSENISVEALTQYLIIISISFGFQWLAGFYSSGLMGLQRQVLLNVLNITFGTLRSVGSLVVLAFVSPTIQALLIWQTIVTVINTLTLIIAFWKHVPKPEIKARFRLDLLKGVWKYAVGMTGVNLVSLILTQVDKIVLSKLLTLEQFSYYSLVNTLTVTGLGTIVSSVMTVYFPKFSQVVAQNNHQEIRKVYHQATQTLSFFLIPSTLVLAFFAPAILLLWTHNQDVVNNASLLLTLVTIGTGLNGIMHLPYNMQLANGITKFAFWKNVVAVIILIPMMIYLATKYGAVGAAIIWCLLNFLYFVIEVPVMHNILLKDKLKGEMKQWYLEDVCLPIILITIILYICQSYLNLNELPRLTLFITLAGLSLLALSATALSLKVIRDMLFRYLGKTLKLLNYGT
jgi:O-antigen/teichoic acid export membrane protein